MVLVPPPVEVIGHDVDQVKRLNQGRHVISFLGAGQDMVIEYVHTNIAFTICYWCK